MTGQKAGGKKSGIGFPRRKEKLKLLLLPSFPSPLYIWEISHYFFFLLRYYFLLFLGGCAIESGDSAALLPTESERQQSACRISDIFAAFSAFIASSAECIFCPDIRRHYFKTLQCNLHLTGTMLEFFKQPFATAKKNIYSTAEGGRFLAPQLCCDTWQKPIDRAREGGGEIMDRS